MVWQFLTRFFSFAKNRFWPQFFTHQVKVALAVSQKRELEILRIGVDVDQCVYKGKTPSHTSVSLQKKISPWSWSHTLTKSTPTLVEDNWCEWKKVPLSPKNCICPEICQVQLSSLKEMGYMDLFVLLKRDDGAAI